MLKGLMEYTDEWDTLGSRKKWQRIHVNRKNSSFKTIKETEKVQSDL